MVAPNDPTPGSDPGPPGMRRRRQAVASLKRHGAIFVVMSLFFVAIWAASGADGAFWPIWAILGWGLGLAFHAVRVLTPTSPGDDRGLDPGR